MTTTLLESGTVITMDPDLGVLTDVEILVVDGRIEAIGEAVGDAANDAERVDFSDHIVLPGLVNAHAHLFQTGIRGIAGDFSHADYREVIKTRLRPEYEPQDVYLGDLFGALEQLAAGVTTVLDWCHVINTPAHADRAVNGLIDSGIRAVFAYGVGAGHERSEPHPADARRIAEDRLPTANGRVLPALALRSPSSTSFETAAEDIRFARDLDVVASMHIGARAGGAAAVQDIERMHHDGLLGPDINFVHANKLSRECFDLLETADVSVTVTPEVEMQMGHGLPATGKALRSGVRLTFGSDVVSSIGSDMFTPMRFALQTQRALDNEEAMAAGEPVDGVSIRCLDVLRSATIDGARALGIGDEVGSLRPGKRADVIAISARDLNTMPVRDPVATVVLHAEPANVTDVFVAGERLKRDGELLDDAADHDVAELIDSGDRLLRSAGFDELTRYA